MVRWSPVGWKHESHRHYLAAKGISTTNKRYFMKGNRLPWYYKQAFAEGVSRAEFEERLRAAGKANLIVSEPKKQSFVSTLPRVSSMQSMEQMEAAPVVEEYQYVVPESIPEPEVVQPWQMREVVRDAEPETDNIALQKDTNVVLGGGNLMTPGVPPPYSDIDFE